MKIEHEKILKVIESSQLLSRGFKYFCTMNGHISNPYHNLNHTLDLMWLLNEYYDIKGCDKEHALLIAMYHDFNHSGGHFDDDINIQRAIWGLKGFLSTQGLPICMDDEDAIRDTRYPYTGEPITPLGKLIRACDCLQWIFDDVITQCVFGLAYEGNFSDISKAIDEYVKFVKEVLKPEVDRVPDLSVVYNSNFQIFENRLNNLKSIFNK